MSISTESSMGWRHSFKWERSWMELNDYCSNKQSCRIESYQVPAILISTCDSSCLAFSMMWSADKLNKHGDNIQPWHTPFPILNESIVSCPVLTVDSLRSIQISQETGKVVWYSHLFKDFPPFVVIYTVKGYSIMNEAEVDVFWNSAAFSMIQWMMQLYLWFLCLF